MAPASSAFTLMRTALLLLLSFMSTNPTAATDSGAGSARCRSYCGNITVDYPFGVRDGCGYPGFRQLLFCINGLLLLHVPSGSYRVLAIDYAFHRLTLHDPAMSDCYSLAPSSPFSPGNGFVTERWRFQFLRPAPDNVFFLLGCRHDSPIFHLGFGSSGPCRNVSGMGCEDYYRCPAWDAALTAATAGSGRPWPRARAENSAYGSSSNPPECCSLPAGALREVNLTQLRCAAYSSAYSLAPLRPWGPGAWSYGIRVSYSSPDDHDAACRACQASGGTCGYDGSAAAIDNEEQGGTPQPLCLCGGSDRGSDDWNSTSSCDSTGISVASITRASACTIVLGGASLSILLTEFLFLMGGAFIL